MSHSHIVKQYDAELVRLTAEIVSMGELALAQLEAAMRVLQRGDTLAAQGVIAADARVDALEHEIGHDVLRLLALRQPIARDLREILAALRIASDIERIGDYAANAAKRTLKLAALPAPALLPRLQALATLAGELLRSALTAYQGRDDRLALVVRARDVELDALHTALHHDAIAAMSADASQIGATIHLLFIAKNLERVGDHATNIAENVWFIVHGEPPANEREKRDLGSGASPSAG